MPVNLTGVRMSSSCVVSWILLIKNIAGSLHAHQVHSTLTDLRTPVYSSAPKRTCSEPHPSLESGENTVQRDYSFQECNRNHEIRQGISALPIL